MMPDGQIYSEVTVSALGTIEDSIHNLLVRELQNNYAWRKVRNSEICKNCVYQWLCPSPYERAAGKETVCTFKLNRLISYSVLPSDMKFYTNINDMDLITYKLN